MRPDFISIEGLSFGYGANTKVLKDISLKVSAGESMAIIGPSGCGKSTLLRILSGILDGLPNNHLSGNVKVNGEDPSAYRKRGKLGFMFQEANLLPYRTVKENVSFPLEASGKRDDRKVEELLEVVGLGDSKNLMPSQLSGGMKTRVAMARSFVVEPSLLLLDEPYSALDIAWKSALYSELEKLKERFGTTVILVTHDVQEAVLLCDQVLAINKFGEKQQWLSTAAEPPIKERLQNISNFLRRDSAQEALISLQQSIMINGLRSFVSKSEAMNLVDQMIDAAGNPHSESLVPPHFLDAIRPYATAPDVGAALLHAFDKGVSSDFKYLLIWDILENPALDLEVRTQILEFYLQNLESFALKSQLWHQTLDAAAYLDLLRQRLSKESRPHPLKKWIYLCDLFAISSNSDAPKYLEEVLQGQVPHLKDSLSQQAAQAVLQKIKQEA